MTLLKKIDPFRALADPTRRAILEILCRGPRPAQELAVRFPQMTRPAVSKHLRILRQAGLVSETRQGRRRIYRIELAALEPAGRWLTEIEGSAPPGVRVLPPEPALPPESERASQVARRRVVRRRIRKPATTTAPAPADPGRRLDEEPRAHRPEDDWKSW